MRRLLIDQLLQERRPDVLMLQEIKTADKEEFCGYNTYLNPGHKGRNGVAFVIRKDLKYTEIPVFNFLYERTETEERKGRLQVGSIKILGQELILANVYVHQGAHPEKFIFKENELKSPEISNKFGNRLNMKIEMIFFIKHMLKAFPDLAIIGGDFNVTRDSKDIWHLGQSPTANTLVSCLPIERKSLACMAKGLS
jgi:exonuclease III